MLKSEKNILSCYGVLLFEVSYGVLQFNRIKIKNKHTNLVNEAFYSLLLKD